jgi:hypothetical protein
MDVRPGLEQVEVPLPPASVRKCPRLWRRSHPSASKRPALAPTFLDHGKRSAISEKGRSRVLVSRLQPRA